MTLIYEIKEQPSICKFARVVAFNCMASSRFFIVSNSFLELEAPLAGGTVQLRIFTSILSTLIIQSSKYITNQFYS